MVTRFSVLLLCAVFATGATAFARPRLTTATVIRLADAEARRKGYDLREYQRPKVHYNYTTTDDTWWLSYDQKYINGMGEVGKHFSVTIEDKTRKVSFMPGR